MLLQECEEFHLRMTQANNNTVGSLNNWTHNDSARGFLPKILYFCGWHSLSFTLKTNNFHGIYIRYGFSVAFLILTIYCIFTLLKKMLKIFHSSHWCDARCSD